MSDAPPTQIRIVPEQLTRWGLSEAAVPLGRDGMAAVDYVGALIGAGQNENAARVLANVLPFRASARWVSQCIGGAAGVSPAAADALVSVTAWLADPSDKNRRAAFSAAEVSGFETPQGSLALSVFLSEGSLAPPDAPVVAPPPGVAQKALLGALQLAAVRTEPQAAPQKWRLFADAGNHILLAIPNEQRRK
jgi:hypothetical protein